jgi:periplasmic protein TonB
VSETDQPLPLRTRVALGIGLSLLLHAALTLPWLLGDWFEPPAPQRNQLVMDLFGMVSERQIEQKQAGARPDEPSRVRHEQAPAKPMPRPTAPENPLHQADSPVQVAQVPEQVGAPPPPVPANVPTAVGSAQQEQAQQTIQPRDTSQADAMRKYIAVLTKLISAKLVYPAQVRELHYTGTPVVRFTLMPSGEILPGSLAIERSSGHAALDDNALQAARSSTPLPPPPRQMSVVTGLSFNWDK